VILHLPAIVMTDAWSDTTPAVNACPLQKLPANIAMWMAMEPDDPIGLPPRVLVTNLSMALRAFHKALAVSHLKTEQPPIESKSSRPGRGRRKRK
jgi:uncharacterized membrane protein